MIVKGYHPLSIVEDEELKKFVYLLCPGYSLPTRKTVSNTLIPQLYHTQLEALKIKLQNVDAVCCTTDTWTSVNNESYIAVTAHCFNNELNIETFLLDCLKLDDRHTAENLAKHLIEIAQKFGIENKVAACTTDNAANIVAAVRICQWRHISCFAHSLNLVVHQAIQEISETTVKVKNIVEYFKRSSHALAKLHLTQEQMNMPKLKLKQDVITRWNSTYDMLERIYKTKDAVLATLAVLQDEVHVVPTHNDWLIIEKSLKILKLFLDMTNELSTEKNVSLAKVIPFLKIVRTKLNNYSKEAQDIPKEVFGLISKLKEQFNKRFKSIEENDLACQATILDPRFKKYGFWNENKYQNALE